MTESRLLDFALKSDSLVFDVGGYKGDWAEAIAEKYGSRVVVYEPVPGNLEWLRRRFEGNGVSVMPYGLLDRDGEVLMGIDGDRSGVHTESATRLECSFRDVAGELGGESVDLMKMNVEGSEYEILERMICVGVLKNVRDLLIQFHRHIAGAKKRYEQIALRMDRTHRLVWRDPFVWEMWSRR